MRTLTMVNQTCQHWHQHYHYICHHHHIFFAPQINHYFNNHSNLLPLFLSFDPLSTIINTIGNPFYLTLTTTIPTMPITSPRCPSPQCPPSLPGTTPGISVERRGCAGRCCDRGWTPCREGSTSCCEEFGQSKHRNCSVNHPNHMLSWWAQE